MHHNSIAILLALAVAGNAMAAREAEGILERYAARLPALQVQLPAIIECAESVARWRVATSNSFVAVTHREQVGFANEFMSRAGGLSEIAGSKNKGEIAEYVLLSCIRSWPADKDRMLPALNRFRAQKHKIILFAPRLTAPTNFPVDVLLDNGDKSKMGDEAALNAIVNITAGWLWNLEYTAALTRLGRHPGVLKSISYEDGKDFNAAIKTNRTALWNFDKPIPAGELSRLYFARLDRMMVDLKSEPIQKQMNDAVDLAVSRIKDGKPVRAATCTHFLKDEIGRDLQSPIKSFRPYGKGFESNVRPGDLLLWMAYIGMDTANVEHSAGIARCGADLIACYVPDKNPARNATNALALINQPWEFGDAEIAIPFPPGRMAPVSGIIQALQYRHLDESIARRLAGK